mmetsp:Transcript_45471/g.122400  ORF Transcript_45471/g.122400 Transcript_45471/m.122400 type:complete len:240 (-) Transcript_45471:106-825(-)
MRRDLARAPRCNGAPPSGLVMGHGRDHGGHPRTQCRSRGAAAPVVHSHAAARQQPLVRRVAEPEHVLVGVGLQPLRGTLQRLPAELRRAAQDDATPPNLLECAHRKPRHGAALRGHGAPANVHRRRPLGEEAGKLLALLAAEEGVARLHLSLLLRRANDPEARGVDPSRCCGVRGDRGLPREQRRNRGGGAERQPVRVAELAAHGEENWPLPAGVVLHRVVAPIVQRLTPQTGIKVRLH